MSTTTAKIEAALSDFAAAIKSNPDLQEKLKSAVTIDGVDDDAISAIAIEAGLPCPIEQIKAALGTDDFKSVINDDELTAEQLEAVAGGAAFIGAGIALIGATGATGAAAISKWG